MSRQCRCSFLNSVTRSFNTTILVLLQIGFACQSTMGEEGATVAAAKDSLSAQAVKLQSEAAQLDLSMRKFALHAEKYKRSKLHRRAMAQLQGGSNGHAKTDATGEQVVLTPEQAAAQKQLNKIPKLSAAQLEARIKTVHELHEEYEMHVTQLQGLVDQYRDFVNGYLDHYNQYKLKCDQNAGRLPLTPEQAKMGKDGIKLAASERNLSSILDKMHLLEAQSPHLPESYLCPAYDDLQREFVEALHVLTMTVEAVPPAQRENVVQTELLQIERLKTEFTGAETLHTQQKSLQTEVVNLQKSYAEIYAKNEKLQTEAVKDEERARQVEVLIERQEQRKVLEKAVGR